MPESEKKLIETLINRKYSVSERDDAAMDLYQYDSKRVEEALILVASDKQEDPIILNSCGESLGAIWVKRNRFDDKCYKQLTQAAKDGIFYVIRHDKPEWISEFKLQ